MKLYETRFDEYVKRATEKSLHPILIKRYTNLPDKVECLHNLIFYGPEGVGKYSQALMCIKKYSPTNLHYEKKLCVLHNKQNYYIRISDIHFEIDMSLLGCNTKQLWNELFNQITDIILAKPSGVGIIMCKNFECIGRELLDIFYSYMQTNTHNSTKIIFVILTTQLSFIPDNMRERCEILRVPRPSRIKYNSCIDNKISKELSLDKISNINDLKEKLYVTISPLEIVCDRLLDHIINIKDRKFIDIREDIYDIFITNVEISKCVLYIISKLIQGKYIEKKHISGIFTKTYGFLHYYNNNYRPIYHLEGYIFYLSSIVHNYE